MVYAWSVSAVVRAGRRDPPCRSAARLSVGPLGLTTWPKTVGEGLATLGCLPSFGKLCKAVFHAPIFTG